MKVLFPTELADLWPMMAAEPAGRIMAGGTDLLVRLRQSQVRPPALFCLDKLAALKTIMVEDGYVTIGAGVTHQQLLEAPVAQAIPVLGQALQQLGSPPIRHSGTIGGNLCTASPAGDLLPALHILDAAIELITSAGTRQVPIAQFIVGPGRTVLQPGELVRAVRFALPTAAEFSAYYKVGRRQALAIAVVSLAVRLRLDAAGVVQQIKLAWGSAGPTVRRLPDIERMLCGQLLTPDLLQTAAAAVAQQLQPIDDLRASAAYRRTAGGNLLLRLLSLSADKTR